MIQNGGDNVLWKGEGGGNDAASKDETLVVVVALSLQRRKLLGNQLAVFYFYPAPHIFYYFSLSKRGLLEQRDSLIESCSGVEGVKFEALPQR